MSSIQEKSTMPLDVMVNKRKSIFPKNDTGMDQLRETALFTFTLAGKFSLCIFWILCIEWSDRID